MDRRLLLFPAAAATVWAQQTSPAAAKAEKALRDQVTQFYQFQLDKKYRQAEAMVAEDTRDLYYNGQKQDIRGFSIEKIQLADRNTRATVTVKVKILVLMYGAGAEIFDIAAPTTWKLEKGQWRLYVSEEAKTATPFGKIKTSGSGNPDTKGEAPGGIQNPDLNSLMNQLSIDRKEVELTAAAPSQTVTITNGLPGPLDLVLDPHAATIAGLTVKIDRVHLNGGEKAVVTFQREGSGPILDVVDITAAPLNKVFSIAVKAK